MSYQRLEDFFHAKDNTKLYYQHWKVENPKAMLVITHGQGEHSDSYQRVVEALKPLNLDIWAWDLRGHGRSEGKRGFANSAEEYYSDYVLFMEKIILPQTAGKKLILLSHSMGGMIQLLFVGRQTISHSLSKWPIVAQTCSAPLLGVAVPVPKIKDMGAHLLNEVFPKLTLDNEIKNDMLTRDLEVVREYESDIYRHNRISSGVYLSFAPLMKEIYNKAESIQTPTLFQIPEADPVCSAEVSREVFKRLGSKDKTLLLYGEGARHEIYNDLGREKAFADLRHFLQDHLGDRK